ncbi:MAG: CDP-alcohol phosphatidyltransferase family protein [Xanthomonadales bacterium]|nr:CDP-alcohol phosphatidyltransferase family protein [Xanthomonadales bacterium]
MVRHLPNLITALRIVLVIPLCWLIDEGRYPAALGLVAVAGASDGVDGFLARRYGWQSWIGGILDPLADKLMLTVAFVCLALSGQLPVWLALIVVGRDLVIVCGAFAYHFLIGPFEAAPSRLSKATTAIQIAFVLATLLRSSAWLAIPGWLWLVLALATAAITLASGFHYVMVWTARARHARRGPGERLQ